MSSRAARRMLFELLSEDAPRVCLLDVNLLFHDFCRIFFGSCYVGPRRRYVLDGKATI
jgi:hypothetical protein